MKDLHKLDRYRRIDPLVCSIFGNTGDSKCGAFNVTHPITRVEFHIIAVAAEGWDHVSVSLRDRCPTWEEMEWIKRMFFEEHETAMQLHVPPSKHIDRHPYCLHLWRSQTVEIPLPPSEMV